MISSIYLLAIGLSPEWEYSFERQLKSYLSQKKGDNWEIIACTIKNDNFIRKVLYNLDHINDKEEEKESTFKAAYTVLRLSIEATNDTRFRPLPWLEKLSREFILENRHSLCAGYFFYFIEGNNDIELKIFASCNDNGVALTEKDTNDDYSYIKNLTGFLYRHLIYHDAEEHYPDITANLLLQFG